MGQNMWFFVKQLPRAVCWTQPLQFSWVGDLVRRSIPIFWRSISAWSHILNYFWAKSV
jgi:hypothetical protein